MLCIVPVEYKKLSNTLSLDTLIE